MVMVCAVTSVESEVEEPYPASGPHSTRLSDGSSVVHSTRIHDEPAVVDGPSVITGGAAAAVAKVASADVVGPFPAASVEETA